MLLRDDLYNLFIYQLDINKCILHILKHFILTKQLNRENIVLRVRNLNKKIEGTIS